MSDTPTKENIYFQALIDSLNDKKAEKIITYEVQDYPLIAEKIVLCSANNNIHLNALMQALKDAHIELKSEDKHVGHLQFSGEKQSAWLIVETGVCIIHILTEEMRGYYALDELFTNYATVVHHETDH